MCRLALSLPLALLLPGVSHADPLAFVPDSVQLVVKAPSPRKLAEAFTRLDAAREAQRLAPVRSALESSAARRFFQMLRHVERELGGQWPKLLDQLAGRGLAVGAHFGDGKPAILVLEGTDEDQSKKAFHLFVQIVGDELQRQGVPGRPKLEQKKGIERVQFGKEFLAARKGTFILVSNHGPFLDRALQTGSRGKGTGSVSARPTFLAAEKLLPRNPLALLWIDFASVKKDQATKDFFANSRKDFLQMLVAGSTIDCLRRSDFVVAGLLEEKDGLRLAIRLPAGRDQFPPDFALHVPPGKHQPGALPLLEPPGVVLSQSIYLDLGYYWKHRTRFINKEMLKDFEKGEKQISKFLPGKVTLGELLEAWGPYHRGVVLNHDRLPYKTAPAVRFPAFGYVASMRDPKFGQGVDSSLRSAALLATFQFGLKQSEIEHEGVKIVAYRFPEKKALEADPDGIRFNFEPCFATVGDQFIAATTVEACKKLIVEVKRTAKAPASPAVWRVRGYAAAAERLLYAIPDSFVTDAILATGIGIEEAREQVSAIGAWMKKLGAAQIEIDEAPTTYKLDLVWTKGAAAKR